MGVAAVTSQFQPNLVEWGDIPGLGEWEVGHYRQHLAYQAALAARTPPVIIATYPIFHVGDDPKQVHAWLISHENLHEVLRSYANITSSNLSDVDWGQENQFYEWLDIHNLEHQLLDKVFNVG